MTTEAEFRAKADARVIEAMAYAIAEADGTTDSYAAMARAALDAYRAAMWMPMSEVPKDVHILVGTDNAHGLPPFTTIVKHHPDGGFCVDELREPIACQPLPLPPTEEPK